MSRSISQASMDRAFFSMLRGDNSEMFLLGRGSRDSEIV